jgi:hypothetical protein
MKTRLLSPILAHLLAASAALAQEPAPVLSFSGYADADFTTSFAGGGFKDPTHITGLEIDLTTTITFSPRLNAVLYTTMNDGVVPAQGAGNTWDGVNFDGVALNWQYDDKTMIYVGDLIHGTGYFNYYLNKRSAVVVGEHAVRGVGFSRSGLTVTTGVSNMGVPGAPDTSTTPATPTYQPTTWSAFVKYDYVPAKGMTLTPSAKYTLGVPGATPFTGGLSFDGTFGSLSLSADAAVNYYNSDYDPGFTLLVEPLYTMDKYSIAAAFFLNAKGAAKPLAPAVAPNFPSQTLTGAEFDDLFIYVEPGYAINGTWALGLPVEFHDASATNLFLQGYDQSVWVVPTVYIYPGSGVQWWIWAQIVKPTTVQPGSGASTDPRYFAGSEIIFKF